MRNSYCRQVSKDMSFLLSLGERSNQRIMGLFRLEKTSEIIKSKHQAYQQKHSFKCHVQSSHEKDSYSITSLCSLFQSLTTHSVKKFFLVSNLNFPWCNLRPCPLPLSLLAWEKTPSPYCNLLSNSCRE